MSKLSKRISAFDQLGQFLRLLLAKDMKALSQEELRQWHPSVEEMSKLQDQLLDYYEHSHHYNGWFSQDFVRMALEDWSLALTKSMLSDWLKPYHLSESIEAKRIGVVMAGNLPLVGFHDYLSVLITGHQLKAKLSSDDAHLLPILNQILVIIDPDLAQQAEFTKDQLKNFDAVIATGSNNTARYFEFYFGKYPHIIRKNRNGIAILNGNETKEDLEKLSMDMMAYYGLGCRSVSKLYVPSGYEFRSLFEALEGFNHFQHHSKYYNNYEYNKAIFLVNKETHRDNGFLLLKEAPSLASSISVIHYEIYESLPNLLKELDIRKDDIQCLIGNEESLFGFGQAQHPSLNDYADGVDTIQFLKEL